MKGAKSSPSSSKSGGGASSIPAPLVRGASSPNTVVVLHQDESAIISIDICAGAITKSMSRQVDGGADKTVERLRMLFQEDDDAPTSSRKKTNKNKEAMLQRCPQVQIFGEPGIFNDNSPITDDVRQRLVPLDVAQSNLRLWPYARLVRIGTTLELAVRYNVPTIISMGNPSAPVVGIPCICGPITTAFSASSEFRYEWSVCDDDDDGATRIVVGHASFYTPTAEHRGRHLQLRISPTTDGDVWSEMRLRTPIQDAPPLADRWTHTTSATTAPAFRVASYNILYEDFCSTKSARTKIYPFATMEVLDIANRQVKIAHELMHMHADVVALQECGKKLFRDYLLPVMEACGYIGVYHNKSGQVQEGCALLLRQDRYHIVQSSRISLNWEYFATHDAEMAAQIASTHPELKEALERITSIGSCVIVYDQRTQRELVVGNTHLFYHANACHIRILQAYMMVKELHRLAEEGGADVRRSVLLCGDLNCTHTTGAYRLLTTGQVEDHHHSWEKGKLFWWGCDRQLGYSETELAEVMEGGGVEDAPRQPVTVARAKTSVDDERPPLENFFAKSLSTGRRLDDCYGRTDPSLPWTNYTMTFKEVIDYILVSHDDVEVCKTVPIPPEEELCAQFALPNAKYPSDHVALVADLQFRDSTT